MAVTAPVGRPPGASAGYADRVLRGGTATATAGLLLAVTAMVTMLAVQARPAAERFGAGFVTGSAWDAKTERYGVLPELYGTAMSSAIAVLVGGVLGLSVAVTLTQGYLPAGPTAVLRTAVDLLAAVPSVVYGLWGITVVVPALRPFFEWVHEHIGSLPIFGTSPQGVGLLPAALVLGVMILPTVAAVAREALDAVDPNLREAAYGLGATRWEVLRYVTLPAARRGVFGAVALAFGRAAGETMAVAMLIGGAHTVSASLFAPASTLTALLANKFPEAATPLDVGTLMYAALVLLGLNMAVQIPAGWLLRERKGAA